MGDCVAVCKFDAIHMNPVTLLPEVIDELCTSCGACVKACPKSIIELRKRSKKDRKIFVSCVNQDKGAVAKKACTVACIGCKACVKVCQFDAITVENFLAYIDPMKCTLCRKCVVVCPTDSILEINFPPRKAVEPEPALTAESAN
jgi:ferredoxin